MSQISFKIITPERTLFSEMVDQITLQTTEGEITVLPGHIPIISTMSPGELRFVQGNEEIPMVVLGGFVEITKTSVIVLADAAEKVEEILEERAIEAKKQAEELRQSKIADREDFAALSAKIEKELARLKVAQKYKKRKRPRL
ncbi:ATP synthase F1 subunit epsilon [Patescibacteria group bacterium]|nr:ATP synthase F1 subunit epsilon [Patescibacteria group bacterium]MBU1932244.1 ATP synthase F1 subunit epsilon [Patescibacteria group bacterium]